MTSAAPSSSDDDHEDVIVGSGLSVVMGVIRELLGRDFPDDAVETEIDGLEVVSLDLAHLLPLGATSDADALEELCDAVADAADAAWGEARRFEADAAHLSEEGPLDLRQLPTRVIHSLGAERAIWWPVEDRAVMLVNNSHADPDRHVAAVVVTLQQHLVGLPPDYLLWHGRAVAGEPTPWSDQGLRFLSGGEEPEVIDQSYLTDADRADPDIMANVEAMAATAELITWVAEDDDSRAIGYWHGPDDAEFEESPIVGLDTEGQFELLAGRTLSEALCGHFASFADDEDAEFARLADLCRAQGVAVAARLDDLATPPTPIRPADHRSERYERLRRGR
ncbi:MAG: hypothetical protein QM621_09595 [Aeromicrobium sp.]|uniref:hypothetical protein n=1 Tax=Aeromicrobium sp. TaxID=1871063 RepID=UPI0039E29A3E